ncbi:MAG: hypothetical protein HRU35_05725 [Rickettsiaceae bacterium]|nr:hypothetical protein [Rickettsiaceae bacterium]
MISQEIIKKIFLFNKLSNTELNEFIKKAKIITLKEGELLFRQDDSAKQSMWYLMEV